MASVGESLAQVPKIGRLRLRVPNSCEQYVEIYKSPSTMLYPLGPRRSHSATLEHFADGYPKAGLPE
jgi:hypothetical protein